MLAERMTTDANKGISSITWNVLGLPETVTFSSGVVINYSYAADGTKLREARTASGTTTKTDYTGTLVLEDGTRSRMLFDGGYISMSDNAYHFFLTDHLGSVRVVASAKRVGAYNQSQNNGNGYNPGFPYFGEHSYSGNYIYYGYYGSFY